MISTLKLLLLLKLFDFSCLDLDTGIFFPMILLKFQTCLTHIIVSLQNITKVYIKSVHKSLNNKFKEWHGYLNFGWTSIICWITDFRSTKKIRLNFDLWNCLDFHSPKFRKWVPEVSYLLDYRAGFWITSSQLLSVWYWPAKFRIKTKSWGNCQTRTFFKYHRVTRFCFKVLSIWTFLSGGLNRWV